MTRALQQSQIECTWELGDGARERKLTQHHKWLELPEDDLCAYLASSGSENEEAGTGKRKRARAALLGELLGGKNAGLKWSTAFLYP